MSKTHPSTSSTDLCRLLDSMAGRRVAVVGDLMLDRYIWGTASRISQEAPVPVVRVDRETCRLGGAANVAANVAGLGASATVFGTVGVDAHADVLLSELHRAGIRTDGVVRTGGERQTTVKTRVVAGGQQVVRVDRESTDPLPAEVRLQVLNKVLPAIREGLFEAVILEDYAKGLMDADLMQSIVDAATECAIVSALDPHPGHMTPVTGLSLMTPNRMEAFSLAGVYCQAPKYPPANDEFLLQVAEKLLASWRMENLLVTLGGDGMALFGSIAGVLHIPTRAREVFDVSGAGDTVTASFVLARLAGASPALAATLSNHAAGMVVAKTGTVPVTVGELRAHLESDDE